MERLWTAKDLAEFVGRSPKWVYRMVLEGRIPSIVFSKGTIRFDPHDIRKWVELKKKVAEQIADDGSWTEPM